MKEMFVFQYVMHGAPEGMMASQTGGIDPKEYAELLSEEYNGKPLSEQIKITFIIESCYGGSQLDKIINYLQEKEIKVKELKEIKVTE